MVPCSHPESKGETLYRARDYITGDEFSIIRCGECGLGRTSPAPVGEGMGRYYPAHYYGSTDESRFPPIIENLQNLLYGHRVGAIERLVGRKGTVLDVGCGRGYLLRAFQSSGWKVQGTEFSDSSAECARRLFGLPVLAGDLLALNLPANGFDAIVLWHVLEHVPNPSSVIQEVNRLLKPGGVFLVATPNWGGWESRWAQDKWFHLDVPRHLVHFTWPILKKTLEGNGFSIEGQNGFSLEYDLFSFIQSALNRLGVRHNFLYNLLRGKGAKVFGAENNLKSSILTGVLAGPLGIIGLPAICLAGLSHQGGTVTIYARKIRDALSV